MELSRMQTIDGNQAAAEIAHLTNEVIAIYPITPASPMGEWADEWSSRKQPNLWGTVPRIIEMQSEAGAAGTIQPEMIQRTHTRELLLTEAGGVPPRRIE